MRHVKYGSNYVAQVNTEYVVFPFSISVLKDYRVIIIAFHFLILHLQIDIRLEESEADKEWL